MITIKEQPYATVPQLRYLVGATRQRAAQVAVFELGADGRETGKVAGHRVSELNTVPVFHVLGFGKTLEAAQAMAGVNAGVVEVLAHPPS